VIPEISWLSRHSGFAGATTIRPSWTDISTLESSAIPRNDTNGTFFGRTVERPENWRLKVVYADFPLLGEAVVRHTPYTI